MNDNLVMWILVALSACIVLFSGWNETKRKEAFRKKLISETEVDRTPKGGEA